MRLKAAFQSISERTPRLGEPHRAVADAPLKEPLELVLDASAELALVGLG
jgi:hypothetical protein